ncbi:MAG TPA: class IV adenylate cyclase [Methanomicrobiales archaeon]|nr:class IV adenylate cyclase [Methanomicrobiales archaeon]
MIEYEVKIRVGGLQPIRARLETLGNRPAAKLTERDSYFNAPGRDFGRTDEALRIRSTGEGTTLTYKGPKIGLAGIKAREELIVSLDPKEAMEEILLRLGFTRTAVVRKTRETYRVEGTFVALDEVKSLGSFVEIEAPPGLGEKEAVALIGRVRDELEVKGEETTLSYLEMVLAAR